MLVFISGGVRSGKSTFGEGLSGELAKARKIYLATSIAYDDEIFRRIELHREQRHGKGFVTIEKGTRIGDIADILVSSDTVLLDCLGNLLANEMFNEESTEPDDSIADRIFEDIQTINQKAENLIIISNDVFSDGCMYAHSVIEYIDTLAGLHRRIVEISEKAVECVSGSRVLHKNYI